MAVSSPSLLRFFFFTTTAKIPTFTTSTKIASKSLKLLRPITFERIAANPQPLNASSSSSSVSSLLPLEDLPPKLQEIVKLFQSVQEPKAKYEQLLFYGKNLKPLSGEFKTKKNKVEGCVSQVWVRAFLDHERNVVFEADSDSVLTKGLAALLVNGLSGRPADEILRVSPDFVVLLGLQQSLTPSRNNGFLNMLRLMQKKALQLLVEAERIGQTESKLSSIAGAESNSDQSYGVGEELSSVEAGKVIRTEANSDQSSGIREELTGTESNSDQSSGLGQELTGNVIRTESNSDQSSGLGQELTGNVTGTESNSDQNSGLREELSSIGSGTEPNSGPLASRGLRIRKKLEDELKPVELEVEDVSYEHAGHAGARGSGDGETHFNVRVVSESFKGKSLVKRHRLVYGLLSEELESGLHALSIVAKTPDEVKR